MELGHRLEGGKGGFEGSKFVQTGFFGSIIQKIDDNRVDNILFKVSLTPMGSELVGAAQKNLQYVDLKYLEYGTGAQFESAGKTFRSVTLGKDYDDSYLIGAFAHEMRHANQRKEIERLASTNNLPPDAAIVINRFLEADAYTFAQRFCEDYAKRTGDKKPLDAMNKAYEDYMPGITDKLKSAGTDAERFKIWNDRLVDSNYDAKMMKYLEERRDERAESPSLKKKMISPEVSDKLIVAAARNIDSAWPLRPQAGVNPHYLSGMTDQQLTSPQMKKMPSFGNMPDLVNAYKADYTGKHQPAAQKSAPAAKTTSAPSLKSA